jgi:hypothetical protein
MTLGSLWRKEMAIMLCMVVSVGADAQPKATADGDCQIVNADGGSFALKLQGEAGKGRLVLNYGGDVLDLSAFSQVAVDAQNRGGGAWKSTSRQ